MTMGLGLDVLVSVLLVVMIGFSALLSRRLSNLRDGRGELDGAIAAFAAASESAEASVQKLKRHAESRNSDLQESIDSGRALRDELAFLLDRAEDQSKRLDTLIRSGRDKAGSSLAESDAGAAIGAVVAASGSEPAAEPVGQRSEAETALLKTLAGLR